MNAQEFKELQTEFADFLYNYEFFNKSGYLADLRFVSLFHDLLFDNHRLEIENGVMQESLKMLADGKDLKVIDKYIESVKNDYNDKIKKIIEKYEYSKKVIAAYDQTTEEERNSFEEFMKEFILEYYPPVKVIAPKELKPTVELLRKLYVEGNIKGFKEVFDLNRTSFIFPDIDESHYADVATYYYEYKKQVNLDMKKRTPQYPFNKVNVLKDEVMISSEEGQIKLMNANLKKINIVLHKDFIAAFDKDINL